MNETEKLNHMKTIIDGMVSITPHEGTCELSRTMEPYLLKFSNYIPESNTWTTDDATKIVKIVFR